MLSRCQRFDPRWAESDALMKHLANIAREGERRDRARRHLASSRARAEGSVRDSPSLLDQEIAHAEGTAKADAARQMLGLADRTRSSTSSTARWSAKTSLPLSGSSGTSTTSAPIRSSRCRTSPSSPNSSPA